LYLFHPIATLPQDGPRRNEHVTFEGTVASKLLDEDRFDGDEIYARFELVNSYTQVVVTRDSPEITNFFGGG
jgi:hypothetical protein